MFICQSKKAKRYDFLKIYEIFKIGISKTMICKSNLAFANGMFDQQLVTRRNLNAVFFDFEYYRVELSGIARSSSQTPVPK